MPTATSTAEVPSAFKLTPKVQEIAEKNGITVSHDIISPSPNSPDTQYPTEVTMFRHSDEQGHLTLQQINSHDKDRGKIKQWVIWYIEAQPTTWEQYKEEFIDELPKPDEIDSYLQYQFITSVIEQWKKFNRATISQPQEKEITKRGMAQIERLRPKLDAMVEIAGSL